MREGASELAALICILLVATVVRVWFLSAGLPHAVGIDEPQVLDRALRIMRTGDWNPHRFDCPTLVIYFNTGVAVVRYLLGAVSGEWSSLEAVRIGQIYGAARLVSALVGVVTVWFVYRLGLEVGTRRVGLLAAAQLAVEPLHVSESHTVVTSVPVTALTTLTVLLSVRAARVRTVSAYGWAGVTAGLAAAADYHGSLAVVAVAAVWLLHERGARDRWAKAAVTIGGLLAAFILAVPYAWLDLPDFLNGLAAELARFAGNPAAPPIVVALALSIWFLAAAALAGAVLVISRSRDRTRWLPVVLFAAVYFYVFSRHLLVFGRYALPVVPMLCLLSAAAAVDIVRLSRRLPALHSARVNRALFLALSLLMILPSTFETMRSIASLKHPDTRTIAAGWLKQQAPGGTIVVEKNGPTYLGDAGLRVIGTDVLLERPLAWYRQHADYLVVSARDTDRYAEYIGAGAVVFQIAPTPQRPGPPISVVKLSR
jgi:4-amino-4-deoxy-L-arabinose transferase-like glycosyltransferase